MNERDDNWWREQDDDEAWVQAMLDQEAREQEQYALAEEAMRIRAQQPYQMEFNFEVTR
jgi:hypothetical protein